MDSSSREQTPEETSSVSAEDERAEQDASSDTEIIVTDGVKQLLKFVDAFVPKKVPIEPELMPFLLDYIPAVGEADPFIKIPRPDQVESYLGLAVLDEPATLQTDPTILDMRLRNEAKDVVSSETPVKKLVRSDKNAREIEQWISNIKELHSKRPSDIVHYVNPMPDIESLMQEWPSAIEELLNAESLPTASLDVSLEEYADICLSLLDIPVRKSRIQSLHVLFTLFAEFRNSQHFRNLAENTLMNNVESSNVTDRLEL